MLAWPIASVSPNRTNTSRRWANSPGRSRGSAGTSIRPRTGGVTASGSSGESVTRPSLRGARAGRTSTPRRRSEFATTLTEDSAIAPAANAGLRVMPKAGYRTPIATGISSTL